MAILTLNGSKILVYLIVFCYPFLLSMDGFTLLVTLSFRFATVSYLPIRPEGSNLQRKVEQGAVVITTYGQRLLRNLCLAQRKSKYNPVKSLSFV